MVTTHNKALPPIIQGGMGAAVSAWPLARAVSKCGQLGVVSGTGLDAVFARRLQIGDPGGHMRTGLDAFPIREMAERIWTRYFIPGGKRQDAPFKSKPLPNLRPSHALTELAIVASFVEVFLAKQGHDGLVGINLLEKIQLPTLPALFGAMLANVDFVLMGAGIPRAIPGVLDQLAELQPTELKIDVADAQPGEVFVTRFEPRDFCPDDCRLARPKFLGIISSTALAQTLARKCSGRVDGFVVEGPKAGGHNAPPRGASELSEEGEPIYGPRDVPDLEAIRELELPFWLAGSYGSPERLAEALRLGATGIQVGTAFAFCDESGIAPTIKADVIRRVLEGTVRVRTDPRASTTGFPFKVVELPESLANPEVYEARERLCDLGFLRQPYRQKNGKVGYRCPAEPIEDYVGKGGDPDATAGRKCLCNGLLATIGLGQVRKNGYVEPPIVTAGDDLIHLAQFLKPEAKSYSAKDVIDHLLGSLERSRDPADVLAARP